MALHPPKHDPFSGIALCAGVGGLELGLHIAEPRYRTVCYIEREVFPASVLVARMEDKTLDNAPIWDDVKTFDGRPWRGKVHILTGGYPCQPFSFCGRRKGSRDSRHLWPEFSRIIGEVDPEWCFFENVEGHIDMGATDVFADLQRLGFTVKAGLFSALETGASQIRRRLLIVAHSNKVPLWQSPGSGALVRGTEIPLRSEADRQSARPGQSRQAMDHDVVAFDIRRSDAVPELSIPPFPPAPHQFADWGAILRRRPDLQPELFGLDHGMADRMDRSGAAGNGVVSLVAAYAWQTLKAAHFEHAR